MQINESAEVILVCLGQPAFLTWLRFTKARMGLEESMFSKEVVERSQVVARVAGESKRGMSFRTSGNNPERRLKLDLDLALCWLFNKDVRWR